MLEPENLLMFFLLGIVALIISSYLAIVSW